MNPSITIIEATINELELIAPLFNKYRIFYKQSSNLQGAKDFLAERLLNNQSVIFLACNNEKTAAFGFTQLYPTFSSVSMRSSWILNDLFVAEDARKQGIATQLLEAAKQFAKQSGAKGLALETGRENTNAQRLYESIGYEKDETIHYYLTI